MLYFFPFFRKDVITFFFFDIQQLPPLHIVKSCMERVYSLGENIGVPLMDSDKKLAEEINTLSYSMFCYHKQQKKTFTVCNDRKLKDIRISEDDDGFSDSDNLYVVNFIEKHLLDVFAELVAYSYLPKGKKGEVTHLLAAEIQSRYSGKKHFVFFSNYNNDVLIFNDNLTEIKFSEYVSSYFSASTEPDCNISRVCEIALSAETFSTKQKEIIKAISAFNEELDNKHGFIFGAITFLDFLAWKGLWQSQDEHKSLYEVSELIEDFREELSRLSQAYFVEAKDIPLSSLISISDTIAVFTPKTSGAQIHELIKIHANFSRYVLERCCEKRYAIRGAIAYGEYSTMKNIMIGPGIDECASWHETGNWIGVHLTPTAQIHWDMHSHEDDIICANDHIPLKSGLKASYCVKWNITPEAFTQLTLKNRALLPEIAGKYTNTQAFLRQFSWKEEESHGQK